MVEIILTGLQMFKGLEPFSPELMVDPELEVARETRLMWIYDIIYGRNAWYSTWVQKYDESNFHLDLAVAKESVEERRVQGSTWTITELPSLAFIGEKLSLIVTEINTNHPLNGSGYTCRCKPYLRNIAKAFSPIRDNSILRFLTVRNTYPRPKSRLRQFSSFPRGGNYLLGWQEKPRTWDLSSLKKIQKSFSLSKSHCGFLGIVAESRAIGKGTKISKMHKKSPLLAEGVRVRDVISDVTIAGQSIPIWRAIHKANPGDALQMRISRDKLEFTVRHIVQSFRDAGVVG